MILFICLGIYASFELPSYQLTNCHNHYSSSCAVGKKNVFIVTDTRGAHTSHRPELKYRQGKETSSSGKSEELDPFSYCNELEGIHSYHNNYGFGSSLICSKGYYKKQKNTQLVEKIIDFSQEVDDKKTTKKHTSNSKNKNQFYKKQLKSKNYYSFSKDRRNRIQYHSQSRELSGKSNKNHKGHI